MYTAENRRDAPQATNGVKTDNNGTPAVSFLKPNSPETFFLPIKQWQFQPFTYE